MTCGQTTEPTFIFLFPRKSYRNYFFLYLGGKKTRERRGEPKLLTPGLYQLLALLTLATRKPRKKKTMLERDVTLSMTA